MDTSKWKSVAVAISVYTTLKQMAEKNHRSVSKQLAYLVDKEIASERK